MCLRESPTRQDTNWPAQLQRQARILKFRIYKLDVSFCLGSKQQGWMCRLICAFVVRIWHKTHFLMAWLISCSKNALELPRGDSNRVPATYVFMENWRKLSFNYYQIPFLSSTVNVLWGWSSETEIQLNHLHPVDFLSVWNGWGITPFRSVWQSPWKWTEFIHMSHVTRKPVF